MKADPDKACPHENFSGHIHVARLGDGVEESEGGQIIGYSAALTIMCVDCEEPFRFVGVKAGLSQAMPMCSPSEEEIRLPIRPASSDPDFGLGIPGFSIGYREPNHD